MTRRVTAVFFTSLLVLAACGSDSDGTSSSTASSDVDSSDVAASDSAPSVTADAPTADTSTAGTADIGVGVADVVAGQAFPDDRCEANKAAGTITYLSGFDYSASASIVEVLVAKQKGYFDQMCLTVEIKPSLSVENYPQLAENNAQFASAGSFSEMVKYSKANEASFVALAVEGKTGIDALIVKDGQATTLEDLRGATIGVKTAITTSVAAMLQQAGMTEGTDYTTVQIDGFDPKVHIEIPDIVGFPGYKSNEPLQLEAAGIPFTLFDPAAFDIPGSFGVLYTNGQFLAEHPIAAQDFMRASMMGLADAVADPKAASDIALGFINASGNAMFLSPEGEQARWGVESALVMSTNADTALGVPEPDLLTNEVTTYADIGLFDGEVPVVTDYVDATVLAGVYDDQRAVIWPAG
jgi:NitT/TauT family transport system substrate-binding protein